LWVFLGFLVAMGPSWFHNISFLSTTSSIAIVLIIFTTLSIFVLVLPGVQDLCANQSDDIDDSIPCQGDQAVVAGSPVEFFANFTIFIFSFTCQQNTFAVVNELTQRSLNRLDTIFIVAMSIGFVCYLIVGVCGYAAYGDSVLSDVLRNFPQVPIASACRIAISIVVAWSYPLQVNPGRRVILTLWDTLVPKNKEAATRAPSFADKTSNLSRLTLLLLPEEAQRDNTEATRYFVVTTLFMALSLVIALSTSDLGVVIALIGATGSTLLTYVLPGFFYLCIVPALGTREGNDKLLTTGAALSGQADSAGGGTRSSTFDSFFDSFGARASEWLRGKVRTDSGVGSLANTPPGDERGLHFQAVVQLILGCIIMPLALSFEIYTFATGGSGGG
jgi:amino acid permease